MKPPQTRKTKKKIADNRNGYGNIYLSATGGSITMYEAGESRFPPTFRGREEIEKLRDYCDAWLDHYDAQVESNE